MELRAPDRISFTYDKLGRQNGVIYYYIVQPGHRTLIKELLGEFEYLTTEEDKKTLRRISRTNEYSEYDLERLMILRKMYLQDLNELKNNKK